MHGLSLVNRDAGRHLLRSPNPAFRLNSDRRSAAHRKLFPTGTDISKRPFARPQRELVSEPPFRGRCSWPTYSISTGPLPNPLQSDVLECPADFRSPPGFFMPFGIKAFSQFSLPEVHLRKPPDFPSLPVVRLHFIDDDHGSTFQVRYVLRGSLFSMNLLEPGPSCAGTESQSNEF
jgi:hypothetical protein